VAGSGGAAKRVGCGRPELASASGIKLNGQFELTRGSARQKIAKRSRPVDIKNLNRAIRYRRLAIAEPDECKAAFLRKLAEEADRGLLWTVDRLHSAEVVEQRKSTRRL
jgi:hypothetical protein